MNFQNIAKLAVIRSKLIDMKLHSSLVNIKWQVVSAEICKYMRIHIDKKGNPILEISDEVINNNSLDTIIVMFVHEFSHRIFKHFEKLEMRRETSDGLLLTMLEYNLIADFVIDDYLKNNTNKIKLDTEIRILLYSHIKAVDNYYLDLYNKYVEMYESVKHIFCDKLIFNKMNTLAIDAINQNKNKPSNVSYRYAYIFEGASIKYLHLTFDNMVNTVIMLKKMIIEMRIEKTKLEKSIQKAQMQKSQQTDSGEDEGTSESQQNESGMMSPNLSTQNNDDDDNDEYKTAPKQDNSIIDPTLSDDESIMSTILDDNKKQNKDLDDNSDEAKNQSDEIIDSNRDYQKEASDKIIDDQYRYNKIEHAKELKDKIDNLNKMQNELSDSINENKIESLPEVLHDSNVVTNELVADELAIHKTNQFNRVLSKIYSKMSSYGDNATKVDYVWRNPRSLMYLQDDYLIQDVKEIEKTGKKKIAVYVDKSGSMGMGAAKTVNGILQTFAKELIDVDIWFWNDEICRRHDDRTMRPYKIEDLTNGNYPKSDGCTSLYTTYEHAYDTYKEESELTVIIISDFEDNGVSIIENSYYNPNRNKHWQYLNVHIITPEYELHNYFARFDRLNKLVGLDNPTITTQILND